MPDLPGFSHAEQGKPPNRRELERHDREYKALVAWFETQDISAVRKAGRYKSNAEAKVAVNRAVERLNEEREEHVGRLLWLHDGLLTEMLGTLAGAFRGGDYQRTADILRVMERQARLHGMDAAKDEASGPKVLFIDSRPPWERDVEVIDGSVVEPPGLPEPQQGEGAP